MFLLTALNQTVRSAETASNVAEQRPEILPWFLGFLVAMFLLNIIISKIGSRKPKDKEKK
ncbi:hypothetical protein [Anaerotignum sp.]|uniref:hypothetical protein n=1 Tax=Anaerotignum sp. TaxID=2039241 RepID=UPI0028B14752|nr:hypothetical protein [Anaerotignum sp.]